MRRTIASVFILLLAAQLLLTGCTTRDLTAEASDKRTKVGIVFDIGGKDDRSFNAAANVGMLRAEVAALMASAEVVAEVNHLLNA